MGTPGVEFSIPISALFRPPRSLCAPVLAYLCGYVKLLPRSSVVLSLPVTMRYFLLFVLVFTMGSCTCKKEVLRSDVSVILHLKEGVGKDYLMEKYAGNGITAASLSSRTENKWRASFLVSEKEHSLLMDKLKNDSYIMSVENENGVGSPTNSSSSGHSKTQPVKK